MALLSELLGAVLLAGAVPLARSAARFVRAVTWALVMKKVGCRPADVQSMVARAAKLDTAQERPAAPQGP